MSSRRKTIDIASQQFYKLDKWLLMENGLKKLSPTAKLLYVILKDREELSLKNAKAFTDCNGDLFQYFDQEKASELLGLSLTAIKKAFKDLVEYKLIESVRQGLGKPNRLYILDYDLSDDTVRNLSYTNKKADTGKVSTEQKHIKNNNYTNSISQNKKNSTGNYKKTKFHNVEHESFKDYEAKELEEKLLKNQEGKFKDIEETAKDIECGFIAHYEV